MSLQPRDFLILDDIDDEAAASLLAELRSAGRLRMGVDGADGDDRPLPAQEDAPAVTEAEVKRRAARLRDGRDRDWLLLND